MRRFTYGFTTLLVLLAAAPSFGAIPCGLDRGNLDVVGLTDDQRLVCFEDNAPNQANAIGFITGLTTDQRIVGIDYRPATGALYGLGDAGGVYILDKRADATLVSRLNVALAGSSFAVDFNPTVDRLRVVSNTGQNLRINVADGVTATDTVLAYTPGTPAQGIAGVAYTNNDGNPTTATTLFDLDATLDQVVVQVPANAGTLTATGKLGVAVDGPAGFDIYSRQNGGTTVGNTGYASLVADGRARFFRVDLLTGRAILLGTFTQQDKVVDIAVPVNQK